MFVCDFGAKKQGVDTSPRVKGTPSIETSKSVMSREKRYIKLKPRKQVKEQVSKTLAVILETPKYTKEKISKVKGMTQEQSTYRTPNRLDQKRNSSHHIIIKIPNGYIITKTIKSSKGKRSSKHIKGDISELYQSSHQRL